MGFSFEIPVSRMYAAQRMISIYLITCAIFLTSNVIARQNRQHNRKYPSYPDYDADLSLWIDEEQVKIFSGKLIVCHQNLQIKSY